MAVLKIHVCGRRSNYRYDRTDSYIAANIQVQYRVIGVHPTGLTVARGGRHVSTGLPRSSGLSREEKRSEVQDGRVKTEDKTVGWNATHKK
jgi:hypothetical protein